MKLTARAPTRIDLAGGTLDIWPVSLLVERAATVNVAIDLYAEATLEPWEGRWRVKNEDLGVDVEGTIAELSRTTGAEIAGGLLRALRPERPAFLTTRSEAPPQSGLGASSALGVAIAGALNAGAGFPHDGPRLIDLVKNVEARVLGVMTGMQDHYPALYGGACCLFWEVDGVRREMLPIDTDAFEERFLLAYTHQPHRSGATNWEVVKRALDGDPETRGALAQIADAAQALRKALIQGDLDNVARVVGEEWEARKRLAPAVSSPELARLESAVREAGADAAKACGAGGGGTLLVGVPRGRRAGVEAALNAAGARVLPFRVSTSGLDLGSTDRSPAVADE
jgi:D-glycero-alpha-D-manno-heptose-7-phosphate kinase